VPSLAWRIYAAQVLSDFDHPVSTLETAENSRLLYRELRRSRQYQDREMMNKR